MITCLSKNGTDVFINAFARGGGYPIVQEVDYDDPNPIIFRSVAKRDLINYRLENNLPFYYMDSGYFGNYKSEINPDGKKLWVRIVKNGLQHDKIRDCNSTRFDQLQIPIRKQNRYGKHILLVLPSEKPCKFYNIELDEWTEQTIETIKKYTDRPIKVRHKPMLRSERQRNTIFQDLKNAHAMVTLQSIAAVEAVVSGVAAFTLAPTAADPVCDKDLSKLENPTLYHISKIQTWANHLAYGQFHFKELQSGYAHSIINRKFKYYESS